MRILLRGDSGFAREALMAWCEANRVDFLFGLARNERLEEAIMAELMPPALDSMRTGRPARRFKDFTWSTLDSWSRDRRVIGKAEVTGNEANPRFVVTSLKPTEVSAQHLYEVIYCARGVVAVGRSLLAGAGRDIITESREAVRFLHRLLKLA